MKPLPLAVLNMNFLAFAVNVDKIISVPVERAFAVVHCRAGAVQG